MDFYIVAIQFFFIDDVNVVRLPIYEDSINTFTGVAAIASGYGKTADSRDYIKHI
jgi:hypothetical protein